MIYGVKVDFGKQKCLYNKQGWIQIILFFKADILKSSQLELQLIIELLTSIQLLLLLWNKPALWKY